MGYDGVGKEGKEWEAVLVGWRCWWGGGGVEVAWR